MKRPILIMLLLFGTIAWGGAWAEARMPAREELFSRPVTLPGNRVVARVIRVVFPEGFRTPEHIHKGPGPRYVLSGRVRIIDREGTHVYRQGAVFWETGEPMVAENVADGETVLLIFEMAPEGAAKNQKRPGKIVIRPR